MDKYCSYDELRDGEIPDAFSITIADRNTLTAIVAPHGGKIESGTTQIAMAVAGDKLSVYVFEGEKRSNNTDLHITSIRFDEPMALALVARSESCITVHGAAGGELAVYLGGLHDELKALLRIHLSEAGFQVAETSDPDLLAMSPINICNRGASRAGAQLEITRGLRRALTDLKDPEAPDRLAAFAGAVRGAIDANNERDRNPFAYRWGSLRQRKGHEKKHTAR